MECSVHSINIISESDSAAVARDNAGYTRV